MKTLSTLLTFLLVSTFASASTSALYVKQKTGRTVSYSFGEKPVITYSGNNVIIKTSNIQMEYPMADIANISFTGTPTDVSSIKITPLNPNGLTRIYNSNGVLIKCYSKEDSIDFDSMPNGTYIIKDGDITYKIKK